MTDPFTIGLLGFAALFLLLFIRMPVGTAMMVVGAAGIYLIRPQAMLPVLANEIFNEASNIPLTILPLFILMGNLAGVSGMSRDLYDAAHRWVGHMKGGLASATIVGCAGFSALSGSSLASAVTMGRVSLPEMKRFAYDDGLAAGAVAAGGTLGILIPPSAGFVVYAILTEQSIGRLFMAGVFPGLLLTLLFIAAIWISVTLKPGRAPRSGGPAPMAERLRALGRAGWIIGIIGLTIGGIYTGVFSAVEAAGIGAFLAVLVSLLRRSLSRQAVARVFADTLRSTGMVFYILFGAFVFKTFVGFTGVPAAMSEWVGAQGLDASLFVLMLLALFIVLGTFMEGFAILVLAVPLVEPILLALGVDLIWFGVLMVIVLEMALISPPVGVNVFVVRGISGDISLNTIFRGIVPFWFAMLVCVLMVFLMPAIALFLPDTMFGRS